MTERLRL